MHLGFFVIFKLSGDIYGKTHLKKCVPYFVKISVFKIAGRTSNFKTCILTFFKTQFQVKSQCQTHGYSSFQTKTHICPTNSPLIALQLLEFSLANLLYKFLVCMNRNLWHSHEPNWKLKCVVSNS